MNGLQIYNVMFLLNVVLTFYIKKNFFIKNIFIFFIFLIGGCEIYKNEKLEFFEKNISELLTDTNLVVVQLNKITDFKWEKLCFKRNKNIKLTFFSKDTETVFKLSFEDYFIDDGYVSGSPAGKCFQNSESIVIKRKYPEHSKLVEFLVVDNRK